MKLFLRNTMILLGLITLAVLFYLLGRSQVYPQILSHILPSPTIAPGASPDQVVQHFFQAVQQKDVPLTLTFCHPDLIKKDGDQIAADVKGLNKIPRPFKAQKIEILNVKIEESARVIVTMTDKDGDTSGETFELRKHQGQWLISDF